MVVMKSKVHIQKLENTRWIKLNPYRIIKSVLKQFYEIGIKEKCNAFN